MIAWLVAAGVAATAAIVVFPRVRGPAPWVRLALTLLRAIALGVLIAIVLDAPLGRSRAPAPLVFIDGSLSMGRDGAGTVLWRTAWDSALAVRADSILMFGDSVRGAERTDRAAPADAVTRLRRVIERAAVSGRPAVIVTDGEVDDPGALDALPDGSRVIVLSRAGPPRPDVAVARIDAPRAAVNGDSATVRVIIAAGAAGDAGARGGETVLRLDSRTLGRWPLQPMPAWGEREVDLRVPLAAPGTVADGATKAAVLRAIVSVPDDAEPRNDTASAIVELSRAASAVFVSTSPDQDSRFAMAVLRGTLSLPTRGFLRVAPGVWRHEGTLTPATEPEVRRALRDAPVAILHGDTAMFGPPGSVTSGPLALMVPPAADEGEWYPVATPVSPLSAALAGLPLDSLPPVNAGRPASGEWTALEVRRGREPVRRAAVVGDFTPRKIVVTASGLWRWRFRGGVAADAYAALWGGIFDWLAAERADRRGALPDASFLRAGQRIRWRRGAKADTTVPVALRRVADVGGREPPRAGTIALRFAPGVSSAESPPLPEGIYQADVPGGRTWLAVNPSAELLPARPRIRSSRVGSRAIPDNARRARGAGALYALVVLLLCVEWVLRRRMGLR